MSLILEALKKSEKSRHDAANSVLPLIVTPRRGRKRSGNSLPLVPIGIIVVALVVIALLMTFQDEEETEVVGINDEPVRTETAAPVAVIIIQVFRNRARRRWAISRSSPSIIAWPPNTSIPPGWRMWRRSMPSF